MSQSEFTSLLNGSGSRNVIEPQVTHIGSKSKEGKSEESKTKVDDNGMANQNMPSHTNISHGQSIQNIGQRSQHSQGGTNNKVGSQIGSQQNLNVIDNHNSNLNQAYNQPYQPLGNEVSQQNSMAQPQQQINITINMNQQPTETPNPQNIHPGTYNANTNFLAKQKTLRDPETEFAFSQYFWNQPLLRVEAFTERVKLESANNFAVSKEFSKKNRTIQFYKDGKLIFEILHIKGSQYSVSALKWDSKDDKLTHIGKIKCRGGAVRIYDLLGDYKYKFNEKGKAIKDMIQDCTLCCCCLGLSCPFSLGCQLCSLCCIGKSFLKNRYNLSIITPKLKGARKILGVAKYRTRDLPHEIYSHNFESDAEVHTLKDYDASKETDYRAQHLDDGMDHCWYKAQFYPRYDLTFRKKFIEETQMLFLAGAMVKAQRNVNKTQRLSWVACLCCCLFTKAATMQGHNSSPPMRGKGNFCICCKTGPKRNSNCGGVCSFDPFEGEQCCCCHFPHLDEKGDGACECCKQCACDIKCDCLDCLVCKDCECEKLGLCDLCDGNENFCGACCGGLPDLNLPEFDIDLGCCEDKCGIIADCDCDFHQVCCCANIECNFCGDFFGNCCNCDQVSNVCGHMVCCECGDFCSNLKDCLPLDSCCDFLGKTCSACDCGKICDCIKECDICCAVADCLKGAGSFVGDLIG